MKLVVATHNLAKVAEFEAMAGRKLFSAHDFPNSPDVDEDQPTFEGNAEKKALAFAKALSCWALADDSGLCVDALGGRPGVHSARYAATDAERITRLLRELDDAADRNAHFVCVLTLANPSGRCISTRGTCAGSIAQSARGSNGHGYDPVFLTEGNRTFAELTTSEKAANSHRGQAMRAMLPHLAAAGIA